MRWKRNLFILIGVCLISFSTGWVLRGAGGARDDLPTRSTPTTQQPLKDPMSGEGLAPAELYTELQNFPVERFDIHLIPYLMLMRNNESGMLRLALQKSNKEEVRDFAKEQLDENQTVLTQLQLWQRIWKYSHH